MSKKLVDPRVYALAEEWIVVTFEDAKRPPLPRREQDELVMSLAGYIQQAIEDWCEDIELRDAR